MSPSIRLHFDGNNWVGTGGVVSIPSRESLVFGEYMPNNPAYTGLLPGWEPSELTPVYPNSSGYISINGPGPYENKLFWGRVQMQSAVTPVFRNCAFAGKDPVLYTALDGVVKCYGSGYYQWEMYDCLIDGGLWMDPNVVRPNNAAPTPLSVWRKQMANSAGVHGGRGTMIRCEIRNVQDSINWVQTRLSDTDLPFFTMKGCWDHANVYYLYSDWVGPSDGSHSDAFQTNTGQRLTLIGNYFGGKRDTVGYNTYADSGHTLPSYNSGDDPFNAAIQFKQESTSASVTAWGLLADIAIHKNFLEGGSYSLNMSYKVEQPNDMSNNVKIDNNYFIQRADGRYITCPNIYAPVVAGGNKIVTTDGQGNFTVVGDVNVRWTAP